MITQFFFFVASHTHSRAGSAIESQNLSQKHRGRHGGVNPHHLIFKSIYRVLEFLSIFLVYVKFHMESPNLRSKKAQRHRGRHCMEGSARLSSNLKDKDQKSKFDFDLTRIKILSLFTMIKIIINIPLAQAQAAFEAEAIGDRISS